MAQVGKKMRDVHYGLEERQLREQCSVARGSVTWECLGEFLLQTRERGGLGEQVEEHVRECGPCGVRACGSARQRAGRASGANRDAPAMSANAPSDTSVRFENGSWPLVPSSSSYRDAQTREHEWTVEGVGCVRTR